MSKSNREGKQNAKQLKNVILSFQMPCKKLIRGVNCTICVKEGQIVSLPVLTVTVSSLTSLTGM